MEVSGAGEPKPTYSKDFNESVEIFQKSFEGYQGSKFHAQKSQYEKAMQESLKAMQDAAKGMLNKNLSDLKEQLSSDLNAYIANPDEAHKSKVDSDIQSLKKGM